MDLTRDNGSHKGEPEPTGVNSQVTKKLSNIDGDNKTDLNRTML